ncbi:unnamed protein product [Urochloa humidicola]
MKRQRRSKSRKSAGPSSPSRWGRPASPNRSGETAASSDPSGGRASSASTDPDEGGDERMRHRRSGGGDGSPSPGEEAAVRPKPKRRRRKEKRPVSDRGGGDERMQHRTSQGGSLPPGVVTSTILPKFNGNKGAALKAYMEEELSVLIALEGTEEESIKQNHEPEQSCSRDCGKIAQDEDEDGHSGKNPPSAIEDEQHSDKIGVHAIEEHKQEQGNARAHVQALLNMDDETIAEKTWCFSKCLNFDSPARCDYREYEPEELTELYAELALYRIRAYELTVDSKSAALDDADLKLKYPSSILRAHDFFRCYEENLEWSFDPELCKNTLFDNYQRLVLKGSGYLDSEFYRSILNTYEQDLAYVLYFEEVANKTKWIEDYLGDRMFQEKIEGVAYMQALEVAAGFPNVPQFLVSYGFNEYMNSVRKDYSYKGLDGLYFEIWKRVAKGKMSFKEALLEIDSKDMFPMRSSLIKRELENTPHRFPLEDFYGSHVAGIDKMASEDKARQLIREAVVEKVKPKYYLDYARKKLDIAKDIYLIPEDPALLEEGGRGGAA